MALVREYLLTPAPRGKATFKKVAARIETSLATVQSRGDPDEKAIAASLLAQHRTYLQLTNELFAAVDSGDAAQGYHLARPMPGGDVTKWWRDWRAGQLLEAVPVAVGTAED
jgi:hypothetical protein